MNKILKELEKKLSKKRFEHIQGVIESAEYLSEKFLVPKKKAKIAALFHDYSKEMTRKEMIDYSKMNSLVFDEIEYGNKELMHGKIAKHIAQSQFLISDLDILNAIEFHTTGRNKMSELERIICLADYIEKNRNYPGVDEIRRLSEIDYNLALLKAFDGTIIYLISKNETIHIRTIEARNYLLKILSEKGA